MDELIKANSNGQWEILEKAKFISPEQQKANRLKYAKGGNDRDALNAEDKTAPHSRKEYWSHVMKHWDAVSKDKKHPDHHLTKDKDTLEAVRGDHFAELTTDKPKLSPGTYTPDIKMAPGASENKIKSSTDQPKTNNLKVIKSDIELIKANSNGQWYLEKDESLVKSKDHPGYEHPGGTPRFKHGSHIKLTQGTPKHGYEVHEIHPDGNQIHSHVPYSELDAMTKPHNFKLRTTGIGSKKHDCYQEARVSHHGKSTDGKAWSSTAMPKGEKLK